MKKVVIILVMLTLIINCCSKNQPTQFLYEGVGVVMSISGLGTTVAGSEYNMTSQVNFSVSIKTTDGIFIASAEDRKWGVVKAGDSISFTYKDYSEMSYNYEMKDGYYDCRPLKILSREE